MLKTQSRYIYLLYVVLTSCTVTGDTAARLLPDEFSVEASDSPFDGTLHHLQSGPSYIYTAGFTWYLTPRVVDVRSLPAPEASTPAPVHPWAVWEPAPAPVQAHPEPAGFLGLPVEALGAIILALLGGGGYGVNRMRRRRNGRSPTPTKDS